MRDNLKNTKYKQNRENIYSSAIKPIQKETLCIGSKRQVQTQTLKWVIEKEIR